MKIIIAGSRYFNDYNLLKKKCDKFFTKDLYFEIVSGMAKGADLLGEKYATENNYPITKFPADWDKYGKSAGYKRNSQMADYADGLIAFWDGKSKGTKSMIDLAKNKGIEIRIVKY